MQTTEVLLAKQQTQTGQVTDKGDPAMKTLLNVGSAIVIGAVLMVVLAGCGGGGDALPAAPLAQGDVQPTGLKVVIGDSSTGYTVYGGDYVPDDSGHTWEDGRPPAGAMNAIGQDPESFGFIPLGQATGTAEFSGGPYNYYIVKLAGAGPVAVDSFELRGPDVAWSGWCSYANGAGPFYSANVAGIDALCGPPDGQCSRIMPGDTPAGNGFIMLPGNSWIAAN